jgi:hypothetical protein
VRCYASQRLWCREHQLLQGVQTRGTRTRRLPWITMLDAMEKALSVERRESGQ